MSHLYEKYTNLGQDHSLKCFDILKGLHVLGIIGFHRSGKKTLIKNISKHYNKLVFIKDEIKQTYRSLVNESNLCDKTCLVYVYITKKSIRDVLHIISHTNHNVHIIVLTNSTLPNTIISFCYIHRCKCPSLEEKKIVLQEISQNEYGHIKNVQKISESFFTYHDCLIALELYENNIKYVYSYMENIDTIVNSFIFGKMTYLQMRTIAYNVMMHLPNVSEVILYTLQKVIERLPNQHVELCQVASNCEHNYVQGNKEIYHYEYLMNAFRDIYLSKRKTQTE